MERESQKITNISLNSYFIHTFIDGKLNSASKWPNYSQDPSKSFIIVLSLCFWQLYKAVYLEVRATDYYWLFLAPQKPIVFLGLDLHPRRVSFNCHLHICSLLGNLWSANLLELLSNWGILLSTYPLPISLFKLCHLLTRYVTAATPSIYIIYFILAYSDRLVIWTRTVAELLFLSYMV